MKYSSIIVLMFSLVFAASAQTPETPIAKKELPKSRLSLSRRTQSGSFYDVIGHRAAAFGYEHRNMEAWVYPLKIVDDFAIDFQIDGYNLPFRGKDILTSIEVRPEATIFTYSHAAFSVRQIIYAPIEEPGIISLLDIKTTLPMTVHVSFRPKLRPMWAAGLMTPFVGQDEKEKYYFIGEESQKFYAIIGSPGAKDISLMPYQEEPKDVPVTYTLQVTPESAAKNFVPIAMSASVEGREKAVAGYRKLIAEALPLYSKNVAYYEDLLNRTTDVKTPDERLNTAYSWAKIGIDKGVATNPFLGTGLLAGFRTSGDSERPGFAWFFGRDALWTAFATTAEGDFETTKTAIRFLRKFQRDDGKIPHEISQSAAQLDWWKGYPYPWNSADATPLFIIATGDYYNATRDAEFIRENWDALKKAYEFTAATDTDGNGLVENTKFGHGWVEGGALYPPHEEIYMQGVWVEANSQMFQLATLMKDSEVAGRASASMSKTRLATESKYWLADRGFYAYATQLPRSEPLKAEPGPNLERRQRRLNELQKATLYDENTVLPAVPMWWKTLDPNRGQREIDELGSAKFTTDWGARILANDSQLYDPLSYHYGSVWGLFTGWQSVAAYNYGRPHVGYQALAANSLLTYSNALGYVTELLSGDFNTPFGRSSHHQVWSEAMVVSPFLKGMLGLDINDGVNFEFAPKLPADWNELHVKNIRKRGAVFDLDYEKLPGKLRITIKKVASGQVDAKVSPSFPLDAKILGVTLNGKKIEFRKRVLGDVQLCDVVANMPDSSVLEFSLVDGSDVSVRIPSLEAGAESSGIRIISSNASESGLKLVLEGRAGMTYHLMLHSPRLPKMVAGVEFSPLDANRRRMKVKFDGIGEGYVKREVLIPFEQPSPK